MSDELTPENFIQTIKAMNSRDRNKLRAERLNKLKADKDSSGTKLKIN